MRLIDADKFKDNILSGLYIFCQENKEDIANAIDDEPTVEYSFYQEAYQTGYEEGKNEIPQGEWIKMAFDDKTFFYCSECYSHFEYPFNFCPICGSDMRGC